MGIGFDFEFTALAYSQSGVSEFKHGCREFTLVAALHNRCDLSAFWKDPRLIESRVVTDLPNVIDL